MAGLIRTFAGAVLIAAAAALSACSSSPATVTGIGSTTQALKVEPPADPDAVTFAFEPFEGIPVNIGDTLTRQLIANGRAFKVNVVPRLNEEATYRVRGHLVAASDDTATIISYVYDIFDGSGNRIHRITGREVGSPSFGDPWSAVSEGAISLLSVKTVIALRNWLYSRA